jgi:hypothetical protein
MGGADRVNDAVQGLGDGLRVCGGRVRPFKAGVGQGKTEATSVTRFACAALGPSLTSLDRGTVNVTLLAVVPGTQNPQNIPLNYRTYQNMRPSLPSS